MEKVAFVFVVRAISTKKVSSNIAMFVNSLKFIQLQWEIWEFTRVGGCRKLEWIHGPAFTSI